MANHITISRLVFHSRQDYKLSSINVFKEPQDLILKLLREGRRTWIASNPEDKCDHFFNYCVTAHALRDWCIKYLQLSDIAKNNFHEEMNSIKYFAECRDIANSSKHFGLGSNAPSVANAFPTENEFAIITGQQNSEHYETAKRMDISILLADGSRVDLFSFLHYTTNNWIETLKRKGIPIDNSLNTLDMFIEYR